jgi:drug/metabolite transporter (DMT)-like permease
VRPSYLIILLALNFCWAAVYSAYKVIALPTSAIVTLRFGLAAVSLAIVWPFLPGRAPKGRDLLITFGIGLLVFVIGQRLQVYGNELGTAGNSAVLMASEPLLTSLAAALFLKEHIGPRRVAGFGLAIVGVLLLNGVGRAGFQWTGLTPSLIFVSSFVSEAAYSVTLKPILSRAGPLKIVAVSLVFGTLVNLLIDGPSTIAAASTLPLKAWMLLLAMAIICTSVGYSLWLVVIRECPINVAALTVFSQAVFGVLIAAVWLGERPHWGQLWGSAAIIGGLVLGLSRQITHR